MEVFSMSAPCPFEPDTQRYFETLAADLLVEYWGGGCPPANDFERDDVPRMAAALRKVLGYQL